MCLYCVLKTSSQGAIPIEIIETATNSIDAHLMLIDAHYP